MNLPRRYFFSSALLLPALTLVLLLVATVIGYYGTRPGVEAIARPVSSDEALPETASFAWPHEEVDAPAGLHRECFQSSCRACHSIRLVLTQPRFPEKKWEEVVHKMVAKYGAPLSSEQEHEVVAYLTAVRGR